MNHDDPHYLRSRIADLERANTKLRNGIADLERERDRLYRALAQAAHDLGNCAASMQLGGVLSVKTVYDMEAQARAALKPKEPQ